MTVPERCLFQLRKLKDISPIKPESPSVGSLQSRDKVEECTLARARRADHCEHLPTTHL
jgi:hypothetical protein